MTDQARLVVDGLEEARVVAVHGREAMNELPRFEVDLVATGDLELESLVDQDALLSFADASGEVCDVSLVVLEAHHRGRHRRRDRVRLVLGAEVERLKLRVNHEIFQDKTTQQIVDDVLTRSGMASDRIRWRLAGQYATRTMTVQYGESDWAFVTRLLGEEGINFWQQRDDDVTLLVFGDHGSSHDGLADGRSGATGSLVPFEDASGMVGSSFAFRALERTWTMVSTRASLRDVDVQNPTVPVDAAAGDGDLEVFEYPSDLMVPEAARARAAVRLQQLQRHRCTARASGANARIRPGRVVEIAGAADAWLDGEHLIVAVEHRLEQDGEGGARGLPYENHATLVPVREDAAYRPDPAPPRPVVEGLETAVVTGPPGEEIHVDDLGRVKVRFLWDRSGLADDTTSRWVRTLQMNLGAPQMLPRVGWEVPIIYENGDPSRPFVLGRLYNGAAPTPYATPGAKATSTLQSATSPSDGTTHELRMGDGAGGEEVFLHATKDHTVHVGGTHTTRVGADRTDDVQKTQTLSVTSDQTTTVSGNQTVTLGADAETAVRGARSETIGGNETIGVTGTYAVAVEGAYVELVGGFYMLRCNQSNATIQGAFTQVIGAALSTTAGIGASQSVAGARVENVGATRSFSSAAAYADGTTGSKRITAGAANETAGGDVAFKAAARAQLKAGGAMTFQGGAKVVFEGKTIDVKAATLNASGGSTMKLGGGLEASSTIKCDAPVTKKNKKLEVEG